jgi:hypothetical protein
VRLERCRLDDGHQTEAAMISEDDMSGRVGIEDHVIMLSTPDFNTGAIDGHPAAHAEVNHKRFAGIQVGKDVLRSPPQPLYSPAGQAICKVIRKGYPQIAAACFDKGKSAAFDRGSKTTLHGFDFG